MLGSARRRLAGTIEGTEMEVWNDMPRWAKNTIVVLLALLLIGPFARELLDEVFDIADFVRERVRRLQQAPPTQEPATAEPAEGERPVPVPPPDTRQQQGVFGKH
jgi:hypothetical protein